MNINPNTTDTTPCKVCGGNTFIYGVEDFNKSCRDREIPTGVLPLLGIPIYYLSCKVCGLVFTTAFDNWSNEEFIKYIYNEDYVKVDPDYVQRRPEFNAGLIKQLVKKDHYPSILDFGGGYGLTSRLLSKSGFNAVTYDPMNPATNKPPETLFDFITSFEVFEHTPTPFETLKEALIFMKEGGSFLCGTTTIDELSPRSSNYWYISPRNGHITIHTTKSLNILAERLKLKTYHFKSWKHLHIFYTTVPSWSA